MCVFVSLCWFLSFLLFSCVLIFFLCISIVSLYLGPFLVFPPSNFVFSSHINIVCVYVCNIFSAPYKGWPASMVLSTLATRGPTGTKWSDCEGYGVYEDVVDTIPSLLG